MKVVIAEKPSLARAIKEAVGHEYVVTHAFGHIYELAEPDVYLPSSVPTNAKGKKIWRMEDLPIVPREWIRVPKPDAKEQISKIRDLLKSASLVINAGDPDREGQLLIDEILEEMRYKGPVQRVWLQSLTPEAIRSAFSAMRPNSEYKALSESATARARADWLVGMNLSRAWTLKAGGGVISVGRVQTPTLALIVDRDLEIEGFKPRDYFEVHAQVQHAGGAFIARWKPASTDGPGFDPDGRLIDRAVAEAVAVKAQAVGRVSSYKAEQKTRQAPLPFSLSALQKAASAKLGLGAKEVLDLAQQLYEQQLTTYPRTDCQYLAEDQLPGVFAAAERLARGFGVEIERRKHAAFDDKKVTAHTAIVPTGRDASGLSGSAAQLYDLIARSTVAMFMSPEAFTSVAVEMVFAGEVFTASGRTVQDPGWTSLYGRADDEDADNGRALPAMRQGDEVVCAQTEVKALKTKPPARWTEGTLIDAMSHIHRFVQDESARAKLKETSGIGTEATRASILETLFRRGWVEKKSKQLVSTSSGRAIVNAVRGPLTDPVTTARWEDHLSNVASGTLDAARFEQAIVAFVQDQLEACKSATPALPSASSDVAVRSFASTPTKKASLCLVCRHDLKRLESKSKKGRFFWICTGSREHGPFSDVNGKPGKAFGA